MNLLKELKRRNVFRVGIAYAITAWLLLQLVDLVLENVNAPDWVMQVFICWRWPSGFLLAVFFALVLASPTPQLNPHPNEPSESPSLANGLKSINYSIMFIMAIALAWFAWERFGSAPQATLPSEEALVVASEPAEEVAATVKSIAVLPFVAMSSGADDGYFADGLTEEILNSLAQLPELLITARTSSFHFKGQDVPVQEIAEKLGVQHIVEGSVRRSGERLRVTAQLVRAADGFHIWSENYDSTSEDTIQVQEDIAEKIAEAMNVVMDDDKRDAMRQAGLRNVNAFINYQKAMELFANAHNESNQIEYLRRSNQFLEMVMDEVPTFAPAFISHTDLFVHMLLDDSVGQVNEGVTAQDIEEAPAIIIADLATAAENARNLSQRNNIELDLAYVNGDWWGFPGKVERFLTDSGCEDANWVPSIVAAYGLAGRYAVRVREIRKCDPMWSHSWFSESRAFLWAGDKEEALRVAREGDEVAPGGWLSIALLRALVTNGLYEEADHAITTHFRLKEDILMAKVLKFSAMGDRDAANRIAED